MSSWYEELFDRPHSWEDYVKRKVTEERQRLHKKAYEREAQFLRNGQQYQLRRKLYSYEILEPVLKEGQQVPTVKTPYERLRSRHETMWDDDVWSPIPSPDWTGLSPQEIERQEVVIRPPTAVTSTPPVTPKAEVKSEPVIKDDVKSIKTISDRLLMLELLVRDATQVLENESMDDNFFLGKMKTEIEAIKVEITKLK